MTKKEKEIFSTTIDEAYVRVHTSLKRLEKVTEALENLKPEEISTDDFLKSLNTSSSEVDQATLKLSKLLEGKGKEKNEGKDRFVGFGFRS